MLRSFLVLLLLANYLLVVGAGLVAARPEVPTFSAAHPYEHSRLCQQQNYLRLDCFEQCNGRQQEVKTKLPAGTGLHFLAQLKGLDVHCGTEAALIERQPTFWVALTEILTATEAAAVAGFGGHDYPPPRRG